MSLVDIQGTTDYRDSAGDFTEYKTYRNSSECWLVNAVYQLC